MELYLHLIPAVDTFLQNFICQGILNLRLNGTPQRPCSVLAVISFLGDVVLYRGGNFQLDGHLLLASSDQILQQQVHNLSDMLFVQGMEDNDLIN